MKLELNQDVMQEALQATATEALKEAFSDWEIRKQIKEAVGKNLLDLTLAEAMGKAVEQFDKDALTAVLAQALTESVTYAMKNLVADSFAQVLFTMRGHQHYETGADKTRADIRKEIIAACDSLSAINHEREFGKDEV